MDTTPLKSPISSADLELFVANALGDPTTSGWPAPTPDSLYVLYVPKGIVVTLGGEDTCRIGVGGYHQDTVSTGDRHYAFAIVPRCCR